MIATTLTSCGASSDRCGHGYGIRPKNISIFGKKSEKHLLVVADFFRSRVINQEFAEFLDLRIDWPENTNLTADASIAKVVRTSILKGETSQTVKQWHVGPEVDDIGYRHRVSQSVTALSPSIKIFDEVAVDYTALDEEDREVVRG